MIRLLPLLACAGCAVLFQEHLPDDHTPAQEPRCSTSPGWYLWDALIAAGDAALILDADQVAPGNTQQLVTVAALSGIAHGISAIRGISWRSDCEEARAAWDARPREVPVVRHRMPAGMHGWCFDAVKGPRCFRSAAACSQAYRRSDAALTACEEHGAPTGGFRCCGATCARGADGDDCVDAEIVWCFEPELGRGAQCLVSSDACEAARATVVDRATIGACVEAR